MSAGDEAASAAIQVMEQRARSIDQLSELMIRILENLSQRSGYTKDDNKGIKALLKHLGNGRDIDITPIVKDDVHMLDEILRSMRIAFVMVYDQKEEEMLLMTRDSDREVLKEALRQYVINREVQKQERSYEDNFVRNDLNANKSVREHALSDFSLLAHQEEKMIHVKWVDADGITSLSNFLFYDCKKMTMDYLPAGITRIGESAFGYCENMALSSLPKGLTSIGDGAFINCVSMKVSEFPRGVVNIGSNAFSYCLGLEADLVLSGLKNIGYSAFYESGIKKIDFSGSTELTTIEFVTFGYCDALITIVAITD